MTDASPPPPRAREPAHFRPDLEGLRAVAVGLVLLYHAGVPGFAGGFVGVDVFFVLSGYLITGLLARELARTGRVSLAAFYARRARRLLPAAALALSGTLLLSALFLPPLLVPDVAADGLAAALYASNMRFAILATDYLAADLEPSPLLHFWSLGVEEQFYVFWPALLAIVAGGAFAAGAAGRGHRRLTLAVALTFVASLALSTWLTDAAGPWAFFTLPARAWELALGGLLALPLGARLLPARLACPAGWLGIAMIVAAGVVVGPGTPFPGTAALLPTLGAALVIAAGGRRGAGPAPAAQDVPDTGEIGAGVPGSGRTPVPPPVATVLSTPPFRLIGRISYSLYLWHWPILVIPAAAVGPLPLAGRVALALLAIPVAYASQRWVEDPIRHGRFVGTVPRQNLAAAGALTLAVATGALGLGAWSPGPAPVGAASETVPDDVPLPLDATTTPGTRPGGSPGPGATTPGPDRSPSLAPGGSAPSPDATLPATIGGPLPPDLVPRLARARDDNPVVYTDGCHADAGATSSGDCTYGVRDGPEAIVLLGDSHAAQWFPTLDRIATARGWRLVSLTKSACAAADATVWNASLRRAYTECDAWREASIRRIASERPRLVVVANSRRHSLFVDGAGLEPEARPDLWDAALERLLARLRPLAGTVLLVGDTPRSRVDPPVCLSAHPDDVLACATPWDQAVNVARRDADRAIADALGIGYLDPTPWTCPSTPCPATLGRFLIYRDTHHLTATYARALAHRFEAALPDAAP